MLVAHRGRSVAPFTVSDCKQRTSGTEAGQDCSGNAPKWQQNGMYLAAVVLFQAIRKVTMIVICKLPNAREYVVELKSYEYLGLSSDGLRKYYITFPNGKFDAIYVRGLIELAEGSSRAVTKLPPPNKVKR